jgi:23S rRNA-/tRNA-specific pseudouridylate synthase
MNTIVRYEDRFFYYGRKAHELWSTRGERLSFFDIRDADISEKSQAIKKQLSDEYWDNGERWLVNRLDRDTAWLLYFAKTQNYHNTFKEEQKKKQIDKYYIADIVGNPWRTSLFIDTPLKHHPSAPDRMLVCDADDPKHIVCESWCTLLYYDEKTNTSTIQITIHSWARHQIRCHLASIGCPIIGEKIYKKKKDTHTFLHLRSIGFSTLS